MIWINGQFTDNENCLSVFDKLNVGMSVFTTMLAMEKKIIWEQDHINRVFEHAGVLEIICPYSKSQILESAQKILNEKKYNFSAIRIQISAGIGARGIDYPETATVFITCTNSMDPAAAQPVSVKIEEEVRRGEHDPLSRIKSGDYGASALCRKKVQSKGFDDVIFLNYQDQVTCASASNIFIQKDGILLTPRLEDGAMNGMAREKLIEKHGAREQSLSVVDLNAADYIWLTNSFSIRPVKTLNNTERPTQRLILTDWLC
ncbi:MAG TPA: aminotransferase class IV [Alphaproteobacteria bacterium]|nr:aminotransferase class IV [Alphaproteobacteria bacterium]